MKPSTRSRLVTISAEVARARLRALVVVARDRAARDHATEGPEREQGRLELRPADVVEVDVDPVGERVLRGGHVVVVRLDPERLQPLDLLGRPGAADHAQPLELRDLRGDRADGARRAGDPERLALLDAADVDEPDPGGQPGHPEHAERGRRRRELRVELPQLVAVGDSLLAPAEPRQHPVALGKAGVPRGDDPPDGSSVDDVADLEP